ncbi:MAG: hypothetical protein ACRYGP_15915 [Janthinobacterium lividum]
MPHPLLSMRLPVVPASDPVYRLATRSVSADLGPKVAILITACRDIAATVRGYRTVLPLSSIFLYGSDLALETVATAQAAGAAVVAVPHGTRHALVRRMLSEVDADIYLLAHGAGPEDACLAPLIVAEIDTLGRDLVDIAPYDVRRPDDVGDRLLARTVDFLFGRGGEMLTSDSKACSRRFALSYRASASGADPDNAAALDLTLHALRLRLPVVSVASLGAPTLGQASSSTRTLSDWIKLLGLIGRLLIEERPRRVLGLMGLAIMAAGIMAGLHGLTIHGWQATLPGSRSTMVTMALLATGAITGATGAGLDSLAAARQEVKRVGVEAIPRRAERVSAQSSVS